MSAYRAFTAVEAVAAARVALSGTVGHAVAIRCDDMISGDERRNLILRARMIHPDGSVQPVIIKTTRSAAYDPLAADGFETSGLVKEWAATTLLGRLLAADLAQGVLVFADLGAGLPSLVQPLLHGEPEDAERALTAYARSLAGLHVATLGCRQAHADILRAGFPATSVPPPGRTWAERVGRKPGQLLGGDPPEPELATIAERLRAPGPWEGLVHQDPCPDNVLLHSGGSAVLIDFEFAGPGHVLSDAAYWWMGFPTCWCAGSIPVAVSRRLDTAYRSVLAEALPIAADEDVFVRESAILRVAWLFGNLAWLLEGALEHEGQWGISTRRNRILHYLHVGIGAAVKADIFPGSGGLPRPGWTSCRQGGPRRRRSGCIRHLIQRFAIKPAPDRSRVMSAIASMTGFARAEGTINGIGWAWELRSVNGRTLELRFRLPNGWDALEAGWRDLAGKALKRGNVAANLTLKRQSETRLELDPAALEQVLKIATDLHHRIPGSHPPSPEALLSLPGVLRQAQADQQEERAAAAAGVQEGFVTALADLVASREAEGDRLATVLKRQLAEITALCSAARHQAAGQPAAQRARMLDNLQTLLRETPNLTEERIAQEVALLASRSDVREELDRLSSHIEAAHDLLREAVNIGRKLDFLIQEFNREANTLCSKSATSALTATGLKLKAAIEQLREQVQNIE
jgi:uncharacterized protein (TIGR00255 family)